MNNLKFRVWCPGGKRFYYNPYIYNGEAYCWNNTETELVKWYSKEQELVHGKVIIEQFTGLEDKNGEEIYCGDIVLHCYELPNGYKMKENGEIRFATRDGQYIIFNPRLGCSDDCDVNITSLNSDSNVKIIGNIHENPELLAKCKNV